MPNKKDHKFSSLLFIAQPDGSVKIHFHISDFDSKKVYNTYKMFLRFHFLGSTPYITIRLTDGSKIGSIDRVALVTPDREVIHNYYTNSLTIIDESIVVNTNEYRMPNESFYLQIHGTDMGKHCGMMDKSSMFFSAVSKNLIFLCSF